MFDGSNNILRIPEITVGGRLIKPSKEIDLTEWVRSSVRDNLRSDNSGFEGEGFLIDGNGQPVVFDGEKFSKIPKNDAEIFKISSSPTAEKNLNLGVGNTNPGGLFQTGEANITQELYMPCVELSLGRGHEAEKLFGIIFKSYEEMINYSRSQGLHYLPYGNMPISTPNVPNLGNDYYKYLFEERDGFDTAYFRGAGLQLHKYMENYELSVFVFNKIRHLLPLFSVLSQNSPFHEETYKGNLSERTASKFSWKMTGIPQAIDNSFLANLQEWLNTSIKSATPYFYAVRYPRFDIKTIENCSMDMVSDVKLIIALIDLYYRVTEKLKIDFLERNPLPEDLFGKDTGSNIETQVISENFNRSIRKGTRVNYSVIGKNDVLFEEYLGNLLKYIEEIPSVVPSYLSKKLGYEGTDFTFGTLSGVVTNGNQAEQTLRDFGLRNKRPFNPILIGKENLSPYLLEVSRKFSSQIANIIS